VKSYYSKALIFCIIVSLSIFFFSRDNDEGKDVSDNTVISIDIPERNSVEITNISTEEVTPLIKVETPPDIDLSLKDKYDFHKKNSHRAESQIHIFLILEECSQQSFRTVEEIDFIDNEGKYPADIINELRLRQDNCKEIYNELDGINLKERGHAWLETAAEDGNAVAKLLSLYEYPEEPLATEALPLIYNAFDSLDNNSVFSGKVYDIAGRYYSDHVEPSVIDLANIDERNYRRGVDSEAWSYLQCEHSQSCDSAEYLAEFQKYFYEYEIESMIDRSLEIREAIKNREWDSLGLEINDKSE